MNGLKNIIFEWDDEVMEITPGEERSMKGGKVWSVNKRDRITSPTRFLHCRAQQQMTHLNYLGETYYSKKFKFTVKYNVPSPFPENKDSMEARR